MNHSYAGAAVDAGQETLWAGPTITDEGGGDIGIAADYPLSAGEKGSSAGNSYGWAQFVSTDGNQWVLTFWDTNSGGPWTPGDYFIGDADMGPVAGYPFNYVQFFWGDGSPASKPSNILRVDT